MTKFWNLTQNEDEDVTLMLYGTLASESWYEDDITARQFAEDLNSVAGKNITVRINSPGGDVFAGQAIYSQLKAYTGNVNVVIDGMCASAATIVAMAGDTITMPSNGIFMIHNPAVGVLGTLDEPALAKLQNSLKAVKQTIVNVYMSRCKNLSEQQLKNMMDKESWLTADEALSYGFITNVGETVEADNMTNCVNYASSHYKNFTDFTKRGDKQMNSEEKKSIIDEIKALFAKEEPKQEMVADNTDVVANERKRIVALNALNNGNEYVKKVVDKAIEDGKTADDVKGYVDIINEATEHKTAMSVMQDVVADQMQSGAESVETAPSAPKTAPEDKSKDVESVVNAMKALYSKK